MSLDLFDPRAGEAEPAVPTTVWVHTSSGLIETTMPRPPPGVGPAGPAGADGVDGTDGVDGAPGPAGPAGATGATGAQGPKGDTGAQGPQGPKGDTGATGPAGSGGVPAGGATGDILVKTSSVDGAASWGSSMPKLSLTSQTVVTLSSTDHAITAGLLSGNNIAIGLNRIQARANGAPTPLGLNTFGGTVSIGSAATDAYPVGLNINDTTHATSRRAAIQLGSAWMVGQDIAGSGVKDWFVYNSVASRTVLSIPAAADAVIVYNKLAFTGSLMPFLAISGASLNLQTTQHIYYDIGGGAANHNYWRRVSDWALLMDLDGTGALLVAGSVTSSSGSFYTGNDAWFRVRGSGGIYWENWTGGLQMVDSTWISIYNGKWFSTRGGHVSLAGGALRLYSDADATNALQWSGEAAAAIDPGSGANSNGPKLSGSNTVWLRTNVDAKSFLFTLGNSYLPAAGVYSKFSSRELKRDIERLDPDVCLSEVERWEPVNYSVIDDDLGRRLDGFIVEDIYDVTPSLCVLTPPDSERPSRPHALDYGQFSVRLTGAVQALSARLAALEARAA